MQLCYYCSLINCLHVSAKYCGFHIIRIVLLSESTCTVYWLVCLHWLVWVNVGHRIIHFELNRLATSIFGCRRLLFFSIPMSLHNPSFRLAAVQKSPLTSTPHPQYLPAFPHSICLFPLTLPIPLPPPNIYLFPLTFMYPFVCPPPQHLPVPLLNICLDALPIFYNIP